MGKGEGGLVKYWKLVALVSRRLQGKVSPPAPGVCHMPVLLSGQRTCQEREAAGNRTNRADDEAIASPAAGEMTLTTLPGGLPRLEAMQAMLKADSGKIEEMEKVGTEKLVAMVIEPIGKGGCAFEALCLPSYLPSLSHAQ